MPRSFGVLGLSPRTASTATFAWWDLMDLPRAEARLQGEIVWRMAVRGMATSNS